MTFYGYTRVLTCAGAPRLNEVSTSSLLNHTKGIAMPAYKPEECDILIFEHMRKKDLKSVVELFEPDATFMTGDGSEIQGHDAIRDAVKGWLDAEKLEWTYGPVAYVDASGSIALLRGTWSATFRGEDGSVTTSTGKNVEVVRRQPDGTWRFLIDHATGAD